LDRKERGKGVEKAGSLTGDEADGEILNYLPLA
jgi:hypothetical protein